MLKQVFFRPFRAASASASARPACNMGHFAMRYRPYRRARRVVSRCKKGCFAALFLPKINVSGCFPAKNQSPGIAQNGHGRHKPHIVSRLRLHTQESRICARSNALAQIRDSRQGLFESEAAQNCRRRRQNAPPHRPGSNSRISVFSLQIHLIYILRPPKRQANKKYH